MLKIKVFILLVLIAAVGWFVYDKHHQSTLKLAAEAAATAKADAARAAQAALDSHCAADVAGRAVVVSISQQHMWACDDAKVVYNNPVVTGMTQYDDSTPLGSYKIYAKLTDQDLTGCDPSGCWDDKVNYWLPYQQASGGTIGFHDASWRQPSAFGHIQPSSGKGSHGCVEMPTAAAKWLYGWASVGTSVTIQT